jgi:hypothetical protein
MPVTPTPNDATTQQGAGAVRARRDRYDGKVTFAALPTEFRIAAAPRIAAVVGHAAFAVELTAFARRSTFSAETNAAFAVASSEAAGRDPTTRRP